MLVEFGFEWICPGYQAIALARSDCVLTTLFLVSVRRRATPVRAR